MAESKIAAPPARPSGQVPSSFDATPEFFEESRSAKLWRRLRQEPLIPLGCAATVYALYQASKSIRTGDHHQTNRMFRARIYSQAFTLLALVGGSIYWKDDRMKRKEFEKVITEKKAAEMKEKWLKELEARDKEDREWRSRFEDVAQRAKEAEESAKNQVIGEAGRRAQRARKGEEVVEKAGDKAKEGIEGRGQAKKATQTDGKTKAERGKEGSHEEKERLQKERPQKERLQKERPQKEESSKEEKEQAFQTKSILEQVRRTRWSLGSWWITEAWERS